LLHRGADVLASEIAGDAGDLDAARAGLERLHDAWQARDEVFTADVRWQLAWIELWAGRWESAAEHAAQAREIRLQYGVEMNQDYIPSAWIAVHRGQFEEALRESERGLLLCEEQIGFHPPLLEAVPGLVALWRGDALTGAHVLGKADEQAARLEWHAADR